MLTLSTVPTVTVDAVDMMTDVPTPTTISPTLIPCVPPSTTKAVAPDDAAPVLSLITLVPSIGAFTDLVDGTELTVVSLKISLKLLIIPSVNVNNLMVASSR